MASAAAVGIMREKAHARLVAATTALLGAHGLTPRPYTNLSKDPDIAVVRTLEAVADDLEALQQAMSPDGDAAGQPSDADASGQGLLTAVLDGNADTVRARIAEVVSAEDLAAIRAIESARGNKARKSVLAAVDARIAELEG